MESSTAPDPTALKTRKCPHLGLMEDKTTWSATDQIQNYCHLHPQPEPADWDHQTAYCFRDEYPQCPVYIRWQDKNRSGRRASNSRRVWVILVIVVVIALLAGGAWFGKDRQKVLSMAVTTTPRGIAAAVQSTPTSTRLLIPPSSTPTAVLPPSVMPSVTLTKTPLPTGSPTAAENQSPTPGPALMTPFGTVQKFLIHNVVSGNNLAMLAIEYNTTEEVLRFANGLKMGDVLWIGINLVVMPGMKDATTVKPYQAVYIEKQENVKALAEQHKIEEDLLRSMNSLGSEELIPPGRWLVVPVVP